MKTLTVISDTHGNMRKITELNAIFEECDYIVHLGDTSSDGARIRAQFPDKTILINGNCDPVKLGEDEKVIEIENVRIFSTHGHLYSAKQTLLKLVGRAKQLNCSAVLYGHTHSAREDVVDGITLINPGTLSRYSQNSYCYIVVTGEKAVGKIVRI